MESVEDVEICFMNTRRVLRTNYGWDMFYNLTCSPYLSSDCSPAIFQFKNQLVELFINVTIEVNNVLEL